MTENASSVSANPAVREQRRNRLLAGLAGMVLLAGAAAGAYWWLHASHFVSTDNAYAAAEVAQVTPSIGGTVLEVLVRDTQAVKQGDVLVRIDPTDARLALAQAEAELARAMRRVKGYVANDGGLKAQVTAREADEKRAAAQLLAVEADMERATIDLQRRQALAKSGSVSGEELTQAQNAFAAAKAQLASAVAAQAQARANREAAIGAKQVNATLIEGADAETNPEVQLAQARRDQAQVDLDRSTVRAPVDGVVARRSVQIGQRVQAGAPLMTVVPVQRIYVDANFKEGQLGKVRVGQRVQLQSDLYGSDVKYSGTVVGFSGGSGSAFAAIPAQNATGNWIKVVQRLPVRIQLDAAELARNPLRVGLSMQVTVDTRSGPADAAGVATTAAQ
ncbi:HlyD family efflux transporter periplasmic adaptor subunit [Comamonas thiooxydans]|uniref:HlyD family efflux transporter periplasmic adaptor subunit n=1 Tax=Comamonas thiooxydans TaxID=363952 RepID=A0AA42PXU1_9BURK|nr:HlyD family efflux transporter periplasmic adaptor subunit [Comamonas thiooxydans]MDH1333613.1 HlyD family efflux transporter periplasmic adaptor subunit [Comamonas thiooxydans]MDH1739315.1 HlyD family efflux transporter periplasmic adaptor subunit [Comamonas thiooxydans]MDH1785742.1 HlyD family efflux transporter periplasmic adaptor subunit [Comamonas thiooxydans]